MELGTVNIILSKYAGFCSGVTRAVSILLDAQKNYGTNEILGQLIHNKNFIKKLQNQGIFIRNSIDEITGKTFIIRAHGISKKIIDSAIKRGLTPIDAVCPVVKKVYDFAIESDKKGKIVIFYGNPNHPEMIGVSESLHIHPIMITKILQCDYMKKINTPYTMPVLIAQTTANIDKFKVVCEKLKKVFPNIEIKDTICREALQRREELQKIKADIAIIAGSKFSANTMRLFETAKSLMEAVLVEDSSEIDQKILKRKKNIFITSGTSTPIEDVVQIVQTIQSIQAD